MFIHTRGNATNRSAKFGRQKRTFCWKKVEKAVSQIKSDRLLYPVMIPLASFTCMSNDYSHYNLPFRKGAKSWAGSFLNAYVQTKSKFAFCLW